MSAIPSVALPRLIAAATLAAAMSVCPVALWPAFSSTIHVPGEHATVQAGIDAATDGDVVLVAPGVYREAIRLEGKTITLASRFVETEDPADIDRTVLERKGKSKAIVLVGENVGPETRITGFTIRNGDDGISCQASIQIVHNRFTGNKDAIDYEGGGGVCRHNVFERNRDDGIDLDKSCAVVIEDNVIKNNGDDGIEIRLHEYSGPPLLIVIRRNEISGNDEDGIQLIDYPDRSDREFLIERNLFKKNAMAAVGCMSDGNTKENYEAADIPEPVLLVNNTFVANRYGVTGGDNMLVLNNVFHSTKKTALKNVDGESVIANVVFWRNGKDFEGSAVGEAGILRQDPMLDGDHRPKSGSPCIDAGAPTIERKGGEAYAIPSGSYRGAAPDLGAFEFASEL